MVKVNNEAYIPLLPYDLGYEETILQLIKSLDCLDKVVECVYDHVRGNINSQKSEIVKLSDKLNNITHKVNLLSNSKKTIQVYSSSKYPASHCSKDYKYSYDLNVKSDIIENIKVDHQITVSNDPDDKLKFYNVINDNHKSKISKNKNIISIKGLGGLPNDTKYINSLLLFNSNENLYKNYVLSNPYKINKTTTNEKVENIENINQPVFSLPSNDTENQFNYFYTPEYEEVPSIDVPADLPDLPGIAGNIQYFKEENTNVQVICKPSNIVDLPNLDDLDDFKNSETITDDLTTTAQEIINPEPDILTTVESIQKNIDHTEENNIPIKNDRNVNKIFNENVNTHSILMDEIRNAGGLKKAKLRSVEDRKISTNEALPTGGGLMADLHKKLAMRRQGISGNNQNDSSLEGVMSRVALTMLPPNLESESEVDGDDDTEGDWDDD